MLDTLKVSQDFMWALRQHWNFFAADATIEVASFSSRICSPSDEERTDFICSPNFFHFIRALWSHTTTGMTGLWFVRAGFTRVNNMWTRRGNTLSQMLRNSFYFCEQEKYSEDRKATKTMKYIVKFLLPINSLSDRKFVLSFQHKLSGSTSPTDVRWH